MRVLFAAHAEKTHFLGMVPLAWALQTAGHEVRVATQPEMVDVVTGAGLTAVPVGSDHTMYRVRRLQPALTVGPPAFDLADPRYAGLSWDEVRRGYRHIVPWWFRLINDPMMDDLVSLCVSWRPDLVVWEPITFAGGVAAAVSGAVHARMMWSVDLFARMRSRFLELSGRAADPEDPLASWLNGRLARFGGRFAEELTTGYFTVDWVPGSLRSAPGLGLDLGLEYVPVRYVPYNGASVVAPWLRAGSCRPRVCVSLGTTAVERFEGYSFSVGDLLLSVASLDVEVVATVPVAFRGRLPVLPSNVRVVEFAPLNVLAASCSVVINHGGPGTLLTTLSHGVPQLVLPGIFDEPILAGWVASGGAGLMLSGSRVTGDAVRGCVSRLLVEPSFRAGASRMRAELGGLPSPNEVVHRLVELTAKYRDTARQQALA